MRYLFFLFFLSLNIQAKVIVISIDGGSPRVLLDSETPFWKSLMKECSYTLHAQTVNPSITLPSHVSMMTGVLPEKHQVDWNSYEPQRPPLKAMTIFEYAKKEKKTTALFASKEKFKHLAKAGSIDFLHAVDNESADRLADRALSYFKTSSLPDLTLIHFTELDSKGHKYGWGSDEQKKAANLIDQSLKKIIENVGKENAHFIITADHGGFEKNHGGKTGEEMTIPFFVCGKNIPKGCLYSSDVSLTDTAAMALSLLDLSLPKDFQGKVQRCFKSKP